MQSNKREVLCVFGANGQGKTRWIQAHVKTWTRAIILDGGFKDEREFPGVKVHTFRDLEDVLERRAVGPFRVRYTARDRAEFAMVCEWARELGGLALVVDEADRYLSGGLIEPEFLELVNRGRHFGVGEGVHIVAASANPFDFPIAFRRQITRAVIFNTSEPNDVDWLAKLVGRDWAEKAPLLKVGEFIEWTRGAGCCLRALWEVEHGTLEKLSPGEAGGGGDNGGVLPGGVPRVQTPV